MCVFRRGRRVAVYLAMPGEVNLAPVMAIAWRAGCRLFVPRVTSRRRGAMRFVPLDRVRDSGRTATASPSRSRRRSTRRGH